MNQPTRPALAACLALATGIGVLDGTAASPWIFLAAATAALALAVVRAPRTGAFALAVAGFALAGGAARLSVRPGALPAEGPAQVQGKVESAEPVVGGQRLWVRAAGERGAFGARILVPGVGEARAGDRVLLQASLEEPPPALNPGGDDLRARLARRGVSAIGVAAEEGALVAEPSRSWAGAADGFRRRFSDWALQRAGDPDQAAVVVALSVGERAELDEDLNQAFNASGLAHLLSISGLHLAVAVLLAWQILRGFWRRVPALARRIESGRAAAVATLPLTALYVILAGAPPPAVRAGIGAGLFLLARIVGREPDALNTLALAAIAILAVDPGALFDPSFQLSFAAMLGLLLLAPRLRELVPIALPDPAARGPRAAARRAGEWLLRAGLATLAASLATAPIVAMVFQRASLWGLAANLIALPVGTAVVPVGLASAGLFAFSPAAAGPVFDAAALLAGLLNEAARFFGSLPGASIPTAAPSWIALTGWYAGLCALIWLRRAPRLAGPALAASVALVAGGAAGSALAARLSNTLTVTFLAVGQGDAAVARLPGGRTLVVDGGGPATPGWDPGARIVAPFLAWSGASKVDLMLLSHPHPDHMDGLFGVLDRFPVDALWHNGRPAGARLVERAQTRGARVREVAAGDTTDLGGVQLLVLMPAQPGGLPEWSENDNSIVARLSYKNVSFLFPGDAERDAESALAVQATVIKAPHHGSATSSTEAFVKSTGAHHVVFCVGKDNRYGHPGAEVVQRWEATGCRSWRTDRDGAVTFVTDGETLTVEPFVKR